MEMKTEMVTLETLGNGAAVEKFNDALEEVIENILDINTSNKKVREIKLVVKMVSNVERNVVSYKLGCETKLAPPEAHESVMYVGKRKGKSVAYEENPEQIELFEDDEITAKREEATSI